MKMYLVVLLVALAYPVYAQTGAPTSWTLRVYLPGTTTTALMPITVTTAQVQCNQAPTPSTAPIINPDIWEWPDVVNAGRVCVYPDAVRFQSLADGAYEGTFQAINADGPSAEAPRVPFTRRRPNPPAVPTGGRLIRRAIP